MNKLFFNNIRNNYNNYENFEFIENFEIQNEQNEINYFLSKKYTIVKLNQLTPTNCCISISDKNFLKIVDNTYGCTPNQQFNTNCGININFWENNNDKFIIIINKDPQNGYSNFAIYLDKPVWLGTNNILEYKFKTFINFDDANNYRNNYLNSTNYLYDIPSYLSYIKINKNDTDITPLNLDNILLCGIETNYWEKNINKIAIISYIPTYNNDGITNKPFAKYKNYNIWNYTTSELLDINDIIYNFIIPLNLSIGYKWIYNNLNSKLNLIVLNSSLVINSICTTFPSSCSINSEIITYLNNNSPIFVVVQITSDVSNSSFGYLYNKQVSYICSNIKETIDDIVQKYNYINNEVYDNLLPINLKNIINNHNLRNSLNLSQIQKFSCTNLPLSEYKINSINTSICQKQEQMLQEQEKLLQNKLLQEQQEQEKLLQEQQEQQEQEKLLQEQQEQEKLLQNKLLQEQEQEKLLQNKLLLEQQEKLLQNKLLQEQEKLLQEKEKLLQEQQEKKFSSSLKIISSEDEQKYNNYLEKRLGLIEKKREELRFIEMSNMSCCIIVSLIMLFIILVFTLCKKKNNKIE